MPPIRKRFGNRLSEIIAGGSFKCQGVRLECGVLPSTLLANRVWRWLALVTAQRCTSVHQIRSQLKANAIIDSLGSSLFEQRFQCLSIAVQKGPRVGDLCQVGARRRHVSELAQLRDRTSLPQDLTPDLRGPGLEVDGVAQATLEKARAALKPFLEGLQSAPGADLPPTSQSRRRWSACARYSTDCPHAR